MLDGMDKDMQAYMRRIGREAYRLSHSGRTAVERGEARRLYEDIVSDLRADREAAES